VKNKMVLIPFYFFIIKRSERNEKLIFFISERLPETLRVSKRAGAQIPKGLIPSSSAAWAQRVQGSALGYDTFYLS